MERLVLKCVLVVGVLGAGCLPQTAGYHCATGSDCVHGTVQGTCEGVGFCSFPDTSCSSGRRFGESSGGYANQCVGTNDGGIDTPDTPPGTFTIGGTITGITGTVVLQDNGGDALTRPTNGAFTFATPLATGTHYDVQVATPPGGEMCNVAKGTGTVGTSNVTDIIVTCFAPVSDLGVPCGTSTCNAAMNRGCCLETPLGCVNDGTTTCAQSIISCDDTADCVALGFPSNYVCCEPLGPMGDHTKNTVCELYTACAANTNPGFFVLCDPGVANPCPDGGACVSILGYPPLAPYYACQ